MNLKTFNKSSLPHMVAKSVDGRSKAVTTTINGINESTLEVAAVHMKQWKCVGRLVKL